MILRLFKLALVCLWLPIGLLLTVLGFLLFVPVFCVHFVVWLLNGRGFADWLVDVYADFFFEGAILRAIDKILSI